MRDDETDRRAGADAPTHRPFHATAAPGIRVVARESAAVYYATGADPTEGVVDPAVPDAAAVGEPTPAALAAVARLGDVPVYGPPGVDHPDVRPLAPGETVAVEGVTVGACPTDEGALAVAVRTGGVTALFTPDAVLDGAAEERVIERAADLLVDDPTRFHDHHRLHGAVNLLDVPRVAGESRLLDHALRADIVLLDERDFGAEVGRQIAAGVSAETTRLASLLGPDGNGITTVSHDDPDAVGPVRAAGRNGFVVETERDLPDAAAPTVSAASRTLVARGPRAERSRDAADGDSPDDAMEPDGRYDPDGDLDADG